MAQKINEKRHKPDFGGEPIERIPQTGDTEQDFNKAMVALRDDNYEAFIADLNTLTSDPKVKNLRDAIVDKFNSNLEEMNTTTDVVGEAYETMADTFGTSMNRLKESAKNFMTAPLTATCRFQ